MAVQAVSACPLASRSAGLVRPWVTPSPSAKPWAARLLPWAARLLPWAARLLPWAARLLPWVPESRAAAVLQWAAPVWLWAPAWRAAAAWPWAAQAWPESVLRWLSVSVVQALGR